jgi:hypothetical protein
MQPLQPEINPKKPREIEARTWMMIIHFAPE